MTSPLNPLWVEKEEETNTKCVRCFVLHGKVVSVGTDGVQVRKMDGVICTYPHFESVQIKSPCPC